MFFILYDKLLNSVYTRDISKIRVPRLFVSIVCQGGFMYFSTERNTVEPVCYEEKHIQAVVKEIKRHFDGYFDDYLKDNTSFVKKIAAAIENFESDQEAYKKIFDLELLDEYKDDLETFKVKVLKNECPIIRKTYNNRSLEELKKYRYDFDTANANYLNNVVLNLCQFGEDYKAKYNPDTYDSIVDYKELGMETLDTDEYTAYKVIGGGIKTHMLFKVHPGLFSNKSRSSVWAFWYLSGKKTFGCHTDSEFLMIDTENNTTQQNYYYPYGLFHYYAFEIYKLLKAKAESLGAYINPDYRYVVVDAFLQFIADTHKADIDVLQKSSDGGVHYYV